MARRLDLRTLRWNDSEVVRLGGEIDLHVAGELRDTLLKAVGTGSAVVVDMQDVSYIDSSGIASLIEAYQRARTRGQAFRLAGVPEVALRVLRIARLDRVFTIYPSVRDAVGAA